MIAIYHYYGWRNYFFSSCHSFFTSTFYTFLAFYVIRSLFFLFFKAVFTGPASCLTEDKVATGMSVYIHERSIVLSTSLACQLHMHVSLCVCGYRVNMCDRANVQPQRFSEGSPVARKKRESSISWNLRIVSGIERWNTAFTFVACLSVTHPLNGILTRIIFVSNKEKERKRERERMTAGGGDKGKEREKRY